MTRTSDFAAVCAPAPHVSSRIADRTGKSTLQLRLIILLLLIIKILSLEISVWPRLFGRYIRAGQKAAIQDQALAGHETGRAGTHPHYGLRHFARFAKPIHGVIRQRFLLDLGRSKQT